MTDAEWWIDPETGPTIERGQTWIPTKRGSGWRHVCEADADSVVYSVRSGDRRRVPIREFQEWRKRFDCLEPAP